MVPQPRGAEPYRGVADRLAAARRLVVLPDQSIVSPRTGFRLDVDQDGRSESR